jgi:hypothetical protein
MNEPTAWTEPVPRTSETGVVAHPVPFTGRMLLPLTGLVAMPLVLLLLDPNWIVSKLVRDPWIYFGYYLDLPGHLTKFPYQYYGNRLSFLLPGFLAYRMFPPIVANHLLHLCTYYLSVGSMYLVVRWTVGTRAAILSALVLGTHPFFLEAAGRDYADGFGIMYFLLCLTSLTRAASADHPAELLALAGVLCVGFTTANLFYIIFVPVIVYHYFYFGTNTSATQRIPALLWYVFGASLALASLALCNRALGGTLWFLDSSFRFLAQANGALPGKDRSLLNILPLLGNLTLPVLAILGLRGSLVASRQIYDRTVCVRAVPYPWYLLYALLVFAIYDVSRQALFFNYFYSSLLIPLCVLSLAPALARLTLHLDSRQFSVLVAIGFFAATLSFAMPEFGATASALYDQFGLGPLLLATPAVIVGAVLLGKKAPGLTSGCSFLVALAVSNYFSKPLVESEVELPQTSLTKQARFFGRHRIDILHVLSSGMRILQQADEGKGVYLWYSLQGPDGLIFDNLAAAFPWGQRIFNRDFPQARRSLGLYGQPLWPGSLLIVATTEQTLGDAPFLALWKVGIQARQVARHRIAHGQIAFFLHVLRIESILDATAAQGKVQRNG